MNTKQSDLPNGNSLPTNCERTRKRFPLLREGELSGFASWTMNRHLAVCPTCRRELAANRRLEAHLRQADVVPENRRVPTNLALDPTRGQLSSRKRRSAGALTAAVAVAAIIVGAVLLAAPGQPGNPSSALAEVRQVEQTLLRIRNAHWVETRIWHDPDTGTKEFRSSQEWWVRLDPPAALVRQMPVEIHRANNSMTIYRRDLLQTAEGRCTYLRPDNTIQVDTNWKQIPAEQRAKSLRWHIESMLLFPTGVITTKNNVRQDFGSGYSTVVWSMENVILAGKRLVKLTARSEATYKDTRQHAITTVFQIWTNAAKHYMVRYESQTTDKVTGRKIEEIVRDQYRYDEPLKHDFFVLNAPPNTPVFHDEEQQPVTASAKLTDEEKGAINGVIDRSDRAWRQSDWKGFSNAWDLSYAASLPHSLVHPGMLEKQLKRKMESERGIWTRLLTRIQGFYSVPYVRLPGFGDADQPPGAAPSLIRVRGLSSRARRDGWGAGGIEIYTVRRSGPHDFLIVGWQSEDRKLQEWHEAWLWEKGRVK